MVYYIYTLVEHTPSKEEEDQKEELMKTIVEKWDSLTWKEQEEFLFKKNISKKTIVAWLDESYQEIGTDFLFYMNKNKVDHTIRVS